MTDVTFPRGEHPYPETDCACGHSVDAHWEVAEPGTFSEDGQPRVGCSHLGCTCQFVSAPAAGNARQAAISETARDFLALGFTAEQVRPFAALSPFGELADAMEAQRRHLHVVE